MKNRKFTLKSLLSLALVFALVFAMAIPAFAGEGPFEEDPEIVDPDTPSEDGYTITINPNQYTDTSEDAEKRFEAYPIFVGDLVEGEDGKVTLGNIAWGDGINAKDFVEALYEAFNVEVDGEEEQDATTTNVFADAIKTAYPNITSAEKIDDDNVVALASVVAGVLADLDADGLATFAKLAADNRNDGFTPETSVWVPNEAEEFGGHWKITEEQAGYYLIVDTYNENAEGKSAVSEYMLRLAGNSEVDVKAYAPDVEKDIVTEDGTTAKGDDYDIGDHVKFRLTGTLPENYGMFEEYFYNFIDKLSDNLDFDGEDSVTVTVYPSAEAAEKGEGGVEVKVGFTVVETEDGFTVTFKDLNKLFADEDAEEAIEVTSKSVIVVEYTATLTDEANIGAEGEDNTVQLEFSNNPYDDGYGKTTEKKVYVYTFGFEITKISDKDGSGLEGVTFQLTNEEEEGKVAVFTDNGDGSYTFAEWVDAGLLEEDGSYGDYTANLTTGTDGYLYIKGLADGTYTLTETEAAEGHTLLETPVKITITASYYGEGVEGHEEGTLEAVEVDLEKHTNAKLTNTVTGAEGEILDAGDVLGIIELTIVNNSESEMPETGGIGLVLFYVVGGLMLAGAAAFIVLSGKKKVKEEQ